MPFVVTVIRYYNHLMFCQWISIFWKISNNWYYMEAFKSTAKSSQHVVRCTMHPTTKVHWAKNRYCSNMILTFALYACYCLRFFALFSCIIKFIQFNQGQKINKKKTHIEQSCSIDRTKNLKTNFIQYFRSTNFHIFFFKSFQFICQQLLFHFVRFPSLLLNDLINSDTLHFFLLFLQK